MRKTFILLIGVCGLLGCASPESVNRQAALNCQAVGITEKDPQFATCAQAFRRSYLEERLDQSYHDATNPTYSDRRVRHDHIY